MTIAQSLRRPISRCRDCEKHKVKIKTVKTGNGRQFIYVDEHGGKWGGKRCPACYKKYKVYVPVTIDRRLRPRVDENNEIILAPGAKLRPCQSCNQQTVNRFYCHACHVVKGTECQTGLDDIYGMTV